MPSIDQITAKQVNATDFSPANPGLYDITNLSYPVGLGIDPDKVNYITFFINVRGKSKMITNGSVRVVSNITNATNTVSAQEAADIVTTGAAVAGAMIGAKLGAKIPGYKAVGAVVGGAAGAGLGYGISKAVLDTDTMYRIASCICLHINESPAFHYGIKYAEGEIGALLGALSGADSITDAMTSRDGVQAGAAALISKYGNKNFRAAYQKATGQTLNPFREILFEAVDFRTFKFRYTFMPKSQSETDSVQNIIKTFKTHMHPELSSNSFFYISPSEFSIAFYSNGSENPYISRIATCALTDLTVEYGGQKFATFDNGAPVEINMELTFRELSPMTRDLVNDSNY
jgi:hypothetical protein